MNKILRLIIFLILTSLIITAIINFDEMINIFIKIKDYIIDISVKIVMWAIDFVKSFVK